MNGSHFNLQTVFHSKLFHGRWEKGEEDKKKLTLIKFAF
jgi:hypothetical protein